MAKELPRKTAQPSTSSSGSQRPNLNFFDEAQEDDFSAYFKKKSPNSNPFDEEDDIPPPVTSSRGTKPQNPTRWPEQPQGPRERTRNDDDDNAITPRELYLQELQSVQNRTLESTHRSIRLLDESEAVGTAAAQELLSQREQLENANRNLDTMNSTLDQSQKHLNHIRSIFGGIKNWWGGSKDAPDSSSSSSTPNEKLQAFVNKFEGPSGPLETKPPVVKTDVFPSSQRAASGNSVNGHSSAPAPSSKHFEQALDTNLDQMSFGLSRLKGLAEGLGGEIESQNKMLDSMSTKADRVGIKMEGQQTTINKILGKKK